MPNRLTHLSQTLDEHGYGKSKAADDPLLQHPGDFYRRPVRRLENKISALDICCYFLETERGAQLHQAAHLHPVVRTQVDTTQQRYIDRHRRLPFRQYMAIYAFPMKAPGA